MNIKCKLKDIIIILEDVTVVYSDRLNLYELHEADPNQEVFIKIHDENILPEICCNANCNKPVHKRGSVYCKYHADM